MKMDIYIWLITISACFIATETQSCKREPRCRVSRIHGMKGADCFKKDMRDFPQCLSKDVEIIDLSYNRIRKLGKNDLRRYSDLKMLYLSDNVIVAVDDETFEGKNHLHTLDLSLNGLSKLPPVVFHLPSLKSLYLGQNLNINIVDVVEKAKPVTSPLVQLDISSIMSEEPNILPEFGLLPLLTKYNISGNNVKNMTTKHFAGLCSLKILDTINVSAEYLQPCDCWTINRWLINRKVQFKPFKCEISENECFDSVPPADQKTYEQCLEQNKAIVERSRMLKIIIPVVIVAVLILFGIVCFVVLRRRKQRRKQTKNQPEEQVLYNNR